MKDFLEFLEELTQEETKDKTSVHLGDWGIGVKLKAATLYKRTMVPMEWNSKRTKLVIRLDEISKELNEGESKLRKMLKAAVEKEERNFISKIKKLEKTFLDKQTKLIEKLHLKSKAD